ncbi:MAG TPA: glycosyl hydrolase family 18 protein [Vicinamibacteria bacterium]|nr:glycosyl hydrolase family 18 protein [Vicinamibacteria bacterium]
MRRRNGARSASVALGTVLLASCGSQGTPSATSSGPAISSFKAMPSQPVAGETAVLVAVYDGGTGVVEPGGVALRSGAATRVGPVTSETAYTLTVTAGDGRTATARASVAPGPAKLTPRATLGYYTGSSESYAAISSYHPYLSLVSADVYAVLSSGALSGGDSLDATANASAHGSRVYACVSNYGASDFDAALAHAAMVTHEADTVANLLSLAAGGGYEGVNLDFENLAYSANLADDRAAYTSFVHDLAAQLHDRGFKLVLSVPGKTDDSPEDPWSYPFDLAALGKEADYLQLMTYDEHGPGWSGPGPVSGVDWVEDCVVYARTLVPPSRLLVGLPAYGYDWDRTAGSGTSVSWKDVPALLGRTGAVAHWDRVSHSPYVTYTDGSGHSHEAWYEDAESIRAKARLVTAHDLAGISMWSLGQEDAGFWQAALQGLQ